MTEAAGSDANFIGPNVVARVLIAWELGSNHGHLATCLRVAAALSPRHEVVFAVRDVRAAAELLAPNRQHARASDPRNAWPFVQAPAALMRNTR